MATDRKKLADSEAVVLHDQVSYQDVDHDPVPGQPVALLYAVRGEKLGGDAKPIKQVELDRLVELGAVDTDHGSLNAKLAVSGQRPDTKLSAPYVSLTSPAEQVRAAQVVARQNGPGPRSNKRDLARLALGDLQVMAVAFGHPEFAEHDSKDDIISVLTEGDEDATSAEEAANQQQMRDEAHVSAREVSHEAGLVGGNVTSSGVNAETGEKTQPIEKRRSSKQQDKTADKS